MKTLCRGWRKKEIAKITWKVLWNVSRLSDFHGTMADFFSLCMIRHRCSGAWIYPCCSFNSSGKIFSLLAYGITIVEWFYLVDSSCVVFWMVVCLCSVIQIRSPLASLPQYPVLLTPYSSKNLLHLKKKVFCCLDGRSDTWYNCFLDMCSLERKSCKMTGRTSTTLNEKIGHSGSDMPSNKIKTKITLQEENLQW